MHLFDPENVLSEGNPQSIDIQPRYHFAFNIPNNKLQRAIKWVHSRVSLIPIEDSDMVADFKNWNAQFIYFMIITKISWNLSRV